jgi:DNA helicase-2/ATP-dependent DNA helicase PcrA
MYRMNAQSRAIEESFLRYGIRYQLVGGTRFYSRREVKDALAYLRVLRSRHRQRSASSGSSTSRRGRSATRRSRCSGAAARERDHDVGGDRGGGARRGRGLAPRTRDALAEFAALIARLRTRSGC